MSGNIREIKDRIVSVEKTKKITQAMKMVSAAKFKRNLAQLDHIKAYGTGMDTIIASLSKRLFDDEIPALLQPNASPQVAMVVLSSDRGLCGGFNANLFKTVMETLHQHQQIDLYIIGNKAQPFFKSKDVNVVNQRSGFQLHDPAFSHDIQGYIQPLIDGFKKGVYSKVMVVYNEFVSALSSNQVVRPLLPVALPDWDPTVITHSDFIYEPSKPSALNTLFETYLYYLFSRAVHESLASEEGFRMAAMDSASSNAKDMIQDLTLFYNRSRQAAITTELTEIVAGAASIS